MERFVGFLGLSPEIYFYLARTQNGQKLDYCLCGGLMPYLVYPRHAMIKSWSQPFKWFKAIFCLHLQKFVGKKIASPYCLPLLNLYAYVRHLPVMIHQETAHLAL